MYPPFMDLLFGAKISVGKPFFDATVIPMAIPVFAVMAVGPMLSWKRARLMPVLTRLWWVALVALAVALIATFGVRGTVPIAAFALAAWIIAGAVHAIAERVQLFRVPLGQSLNRLRFLPRAAFGAAIAHAGMGVTLAGLAGMSQATNRIVEAVPGQTFHLAGDDWTLQSLTSATGPNYASRIATIRISHDGRTIAVLHPSRRSFSTQQQTTTEVAIHTNGFADLYAVLGDEHVSDGVNRAVLRLHLNPLAPWMWFGALIMAFGGAVSLADRRARVGAPLRRTRPLAAQAAE
jgi:cytochrome c-type biogenesis protein CcmF